MPCPFAFTLRLVYSGFSDVLTLTATAPLERVVWTLQSQDAAESALDCLRRLVADQGWLSLWQGNGLRIFNSIIGRALSEVLNDFLLQKLVPPSKDPQTRHRRQLAAGFLAGFTSVAIMYPFNYAAFRITVGRDNTGVRDCIEKRVQSAGMSGLFRGLGVTLASIVANRIVTFGLYEFVVARTVATTASSTKKEGETTSSSIENDNLRWLRTFSAQQVLDVFAGCAAYPLETNVKRRQMDAPMSHTNDLYVGVSLNIVKIVTSNLILAVYHSEALERFDILRRFMMKLFH